MFDSLIGYQVLSVARDVPLGLINPEHLISALNGFDSRTDDQIDGGHCVPQRGGSETERSTAQHNNRCRH